MGFLSPLFLFGFAALAVPLWLHLRRRRRQNPVEFPSLRYLKMATARMKRQARIEDLRLLLLRLLLLALLAAAFARPVIRSHGSWLGAGRTVESVVVIDATASMAWRGDGTTRFDAAKRMAREWINGLDRSDAVALWVVTDRLEKPVPAPIVDRSHLFRELDALKPSQGSCGLAPAFNAAREWAETRGIGRKEMLVITDNQAAAWDWPAESFFKNAWDRDGISLVVLAPDSAKPANTSIASARWDARSARSGTLITGSARLINHGDAPMVDLLECRVGDEVMFRKPVELAPGSTLDLPLSITVPASGKAVTTGSLTLAGDAYAHDDQWHFALPMRKPIKALIVDRDNGMAGSMRPSFFLAKAITAGGSGTTSVIGSNEWPDHSTDGFGSIWFTAAAMENQSAWQKALEFATVGGTVVVTGDSQPDPLPDGWPVAAGAETSLPAGRIATRVLAPSHPLFDGVWNDQTPFPPLPQNTARSCLPADGAKPLATLAGSYPLLVEKPHGKGRVLWLNASLDRAWGDLPLSPAYVALVQQMARASELTMQAETSCWVGEAWPDTASIATDASWPATDGSTRTTNAGSFDACAPDGSIVWSCAVNVRREESALQSLEAGRLSSMLPGKVASGLEGMRAWRDEARREIPLWPWLLAAAALTYLAEGWMSAAAARNRTAAASPLPISRGKEART